MNISTIDTIVAVAVFVGCVGYMIWYFFIDGKIKNKNETVTLKQMMIDRINKKDGTKNKM